MSLSLSLSLSLAVSMALAVVVLVSDVDRDEKVLLATDVGLFVTTVAAILAPLLTRCLGAPSDNLETRLPRAFEGSRHRGGSARSPRPARPPSRERGDRRYHGLRRQPEDQPVWAAVGEWQARPPGAGLSGAAVGVTGVGLSVLPALGTACFHHDGGPPAMLPSPQGS
ncbi:hypothetical protein [Streptomyces sp. NPDC093591]|uniref:hypothetical protein n=1 Tax=Streptomyces sp. NPDC093591 TaxID=3366044 RepID=UPI003815CA8E